MFPTSIFFFIFIIVIDLILKSIRDKRRIEEEKIKRMGRLNKDISQDIKVPKERKNASKREKPYLIEKDRSMEMKSFDEPLFSDSYDNKTKGEIGYQKDFKKVKKPHSSMQEDILKGIIYSEILSKPKSLRNKKSM